MKPTPNPAGIHLSNAHQPGYPLPETNPQACPNSPKQCPPIAFWVLVGIAHLFDQRTILIVISNPHPTILPEFTLGYWWALLIYLISEQF
ncbi:hypothetical protein [Moorena producens]|uniref:hypothetical protein n=1 Tax=Moorena producens TaxID=1155739 RepID=UPI003C75EB7F